MADTDKTADVGTEDQAPEIKETPKKEAPKKDKGEPKEKMVTIRLPLTKEDTRPVYVRVNGRKWGIPRGKRVEVPACVAEVLEHAEAQMLEAIQYSEAAQNGTGTDLG